jgi:dTDP-4-dehydrorhamnose reductase
MTKRILLLGATGLIGRAFARAASPYRWTLIAPPRAEADLTHPATLRGLFHRTEPDLVVNAAGLADVDSAERHEDEAMAINFEGPATLAAQCSTRDIPLVHLSTDYVFDGRDAAPYNEDAPMNPLNVYGYSKMMGEEAIRHELAWHVILRVASVFGGARKNILTKTLDAIDTQDEVRCVADRTSAPTPDHAVAHALATIAEKVMEGGLGLYGTFHFCGAPIASRYAFAKAVMEAYAPFTDRRPKIVPATSEIFADLAPRPLFSALDCRKIERVYALAQPDWQDALPAAIQASFAAKSAR